MLKKEKELAYRGYIDVGAGYAVIPNGAPNAQDIGGFTATIKAYPLGRWYAPLKSVTQADATKALLASAMKNPDDLSQKQKQLDTAEDALNTAKQVLETAEKDASEGKADNAQAAEKNYKSAEENYKKADASLDQALAVENALQKAVNRGELYQFKKDHPCRSKDKDDDDNNQAKPKKECTALRWIKPYAHRTFVFYGRSIGGYGRAIKGEVNSIGVGYDITPEFGLIVGRAWYDVNMPIAATATTPASSKTDTKDAIMFGVQVNLNAFKLFRGLVEVK